ncbi:hypothetical protein RvY_12281 [Ramazzottius varieornatus]|uniref:Uncharacterized protein n=1 Tax=Ramazzottius varieornatus TaxID=947166 RepID=A0A1D1VN67_RAMVA|nr:hypothetical protein RvY_12281 [Ramazzottius varieornatus]
MLLQEVPYLLDFIVVQNARVDAGQRHTTGFFDQPEMQILIVWRNTAVKGRNLSRRSNIRCVLPFLVVVSRQATLQCCGGFRGVSVLSGDDGIKDEHHDE